MSQDRKFKIRFMQPSEAGRLAELISGLQAHQQLAGAVRIPGRKDVEKELFHQNEQGQVIANNKGSFIVVAVDELDPSGPKIAGYLIYTQAYSVARGRYMFLNSFFLEEPYRQHGLGTKFMKFMQLHCKILGYDGCDVGVMKKNDRGQKFYKRFGAYRVDEENQLYLSPIKSTIIE